MINSGSYRIPVRSSSTEGRPPRGSDVRPRGHAGVRGPAPISARGPLLSDLPSEAVDNRGKTDPRERDGTSLWEQNPEIHQSDADWSMVECDADRPQSPAHSVTSTASSARGGRRRRGGSRRGGHSGGGGGRDQRDERGLPPRGEARKTK